MTEENTLKKSIFVALLGVPNAGKSTLINNLVGSKVSIVTPKVQTTRFSVKGIFNYANNQIVIIDTPGIFRPKERLERSIVKNAWSGVNEADLLCFIVDSKHVHEKNITGDLQDILDYLKKDERPKILILNKIDKLATELLLPIIKQFDEFKIFDEIFPVSALKEQDISALKKYLASKSIHENWFYNEDEITDMPIKTWAAELTREKLFLSLQKELPYDLSVVTDRYKILKNNKIRIDQTIFVEKDSQKQIIIGKKGERIKEISIKVRKELTVILGREVELFIFIKVKKDWKDKIL